MNQIRRTLTISAAALTMMAAANGATVFVADITTSQEASLAGPTTAGGAPRPTPFGTATFTLNDAMTALSFSATIFNIDVTGTQTADLNDNLVNAHIHAGLNSPPANNGVVWGFFGAPFNNNNPNDQVNTPFANGVGGTFSGTWNAPEGNNTTLAAQLANLLAGRGYINFHTTQNAGGEIRGAIIPLPEPSSLGLLGVGVTGLLMAGRRYRRPRV